MLLTIEDRIKRLESKGIKITPDGDINHFLKSGVTLPDPQYLEDKLRYQQAHGHSTTVIDEDTFTDIEVIREYLIKRK